MRKLSPYLIEADTVVRRRTPITTAADVALALRREIVAATKMNIP